MNGKVIIEVDAKHEAIVRQALALAEEREQLALSAPDGAVFGACEDAVVEKGRQFQGHLLADAVARRIAVAEKKGADPPLRLRTPKGKSGTERTSTDQRGRRGDVLPPLLEVFLRH